MMMRNGSLDYCAGFSAYMLTGKRLLPPTCKPFWSSTWMRRKPAFLKIRRNVSSSLSSPFSCMPYRRECGEITTYLVTLLSTLSNRSLSAVLLFSLSTITPLSFNTDMHLLKNRISCTSVKCPTHHCTQTRSYCTPSVGCQSSSPMLKMLRTPDFPRSPAVNLAMGSMTSTCVAMPSRRRPSVTLPMLIYLANRSYDIVLKQ